MKERYFRRLLRKTPFKPLRVHLSSGTFYDVPHPDFADSDAESLVVTIALQDAIQAKEVHCSWLHVSHVEVLG